MGRNARMIAKRRTGRRLGVSAAMSILCMAVAGAAPYSASAAPQGPWVLPAIDLSVPEQDAEQARVVVAPDGTTTAVWARSNGAHNIIQASVRPPGGKFSPPEDLSALGADSFGPEIAIGPDGRVTAVWIREVGVNRFVQSATSAPGGAFAPPTDITPTNIDASGPRIAIAADGTATAIWVRSQPPNSFVQSSTRLPGGGFGSVTNLSNPVGNASGADVAGGPDGTITAVWVRDTGPSDQLEASTRPPAGSFGAAGTVGSPAPFLGGTRIAFRPDGIAVAVWDRFDGASNDLELALKPPAGSFGPPSEVASSADDELEASIAVAPDNSTTVVWEKRAGLDSVIQSRRIPANGAAGPILNLTAPGAAAAEPDVSASPDGTITAAWDRPDAQNNTRIQTATRPASGGAFGPVSNLSAAGQGAQEPQLAVAPGGKVTAVWRRFNGSHSIIQSASTGTAPVCRNARLTIGKFTASRRTGSGVLKVKVGQAGKVRLKGSASLKPSARVLRNAGQTTLAVKVRGKAARQLRIRKRLKVRLQVVFEPNDCPARIANRTVLLNRR
jgi:hypothetical protein